MALYTILLGLSIFMIVLVMAVVKKIFFTWKEDNEIESMIQHIHIGVQRPAVSCTIIVEKCVIRRRNYLVGSLPIYDVITKSDISLTKRNYNHLSNHQDLSFNSQHCDQDHMESLNMETRREADKAKEAAGHQRADMRDYRENSGEQRDAQQNNTSDRYRRRSAFDRFQ